MTTPSSVARNTFRVTRAGGEALSESALIELRKAVVTCASKSYATRKAAAAGADKVRLWRLCRGRRARWVCGFARVFWRLSRVLQPRPASVVFV